MTRGTSAQRPGTRAVTKTANCDPAPSAQIKILLAATSASTRKQGPLAELPTSPRVSRRPRVLGTAPRARNLRLPRMEQLARTRARVWLAGARRSARRVAASPACVMTGTRVTGAVGPASMPRAQLHFRPKCWRTELLVIEDFVMAESARPPVKMS